MPTATLELADVVGFVLQSAGETDLDGIARAIKSRRSVLREIAAAKVGVTAEVTIADISPKYLNGLSGVVKEIVDGRRGRIATIALDKGSTSTLAYSSSKFRFLAGQESYDLSGVPVSCCRIAGS